MTVLGSEVAWQEAFQGVTYPAPHLMLVFVGDSEEEEHLAASRAATQVRGMGRSVDRIVWAEAGLADWPEP